ncbi:MAG: hypothetical protein H7326_01670, partial [Bdellovibrionaceae bacterium]|nr:hypothetical protein [Pseudobdellovibrionaceae bacterium]
SVTLSQTTVKEAPPKAVPPKAVPPKEEMTIALSPIKKSRTPASAAGGAAEGVFKKVCISKTETSAPQNLRGKCATRTCNAGKCTYQGQKEMFDWTTK